MNGKLRKLLAFASCWQVILSCVAVAEQAATVDGILRSVVAVRSQLEPVLTYRLAQRTTVRPQTTRAVGLSCGGAVNIPSLQRLFKCVTTEKPVVNVPKRTDDINLRYSPVEVVNSEMKATWTTYSDGTSDSKRPYQKEPVRANPLGLLFPTLQQINQFSQWQRPYQSFNQLPTATTTTTTTTTVRPHVEDFYFPPDRTDDRFTIQSTIRPTQYYTTTIRTSGHGPVQHHWATSTPGSTSWPGSVDITRDPLEESTTEAPEDESGLGNRIDSKLLLSLVG
ncbi:uncharacterized protein LOC126559379 [Anopheles maculipalpis]|uniref:uncharacterized protein LOC126559379 n=1 Tax=Anopheles maculipalpis TaxID=1496333 RepID=UPI00215979D0|nr:uncharacterized protein LOC126559379 [Anopheles maculipalpis]